MKNYFFCLFVLLFISCKNDSSFPTVTQVAFKASESDKYGMMDLDGDILFEDKFENKPSVAVNGIFSIDNDDKIKYYLASSDPKPINDEEYIRGGYYSEGLIPVVKPESPISFINKEGKEVFTLKSIGDDNITAVYSYFSDGLMLFKTSKKKYGYINSQGDVVIKPIYDLANIFNEGVAIVGKKQNDTMKYLLIDKSGEEIAKLKSDDLHENSKMVFYNGVLIGTNKIFNKKGEVIYRASDKNTPISQYNGYITVREDRKYGVINLEGDEIIEPIFDSGIIINKDYCIGINSSENSGVNLEFMSYGQKTIKELENIKNIALGESNKYIVEEGNDFYFIDKHGKIIGNTYYSFIDLPSIYSTLSNIQDQFPKYNYSDWVTSDYFPIDNIISSLLSQLNTTGVGNFKLEDSLNEVIKYYMIGAASQYEFKDRIYFEGVDSEMGVSTSYEAEFDKYISDYYSFNYDAKINHIIVNVNCYSNDTYSLSNRDSRLRRAIIKYLESIGFKKEVSNASWRLENWDIYYSPNHSYLIAVNINRPQICLEKTSGN